MINITDEFEAFDGSGNRYIVQKLQRYTTIDFADGGSSTAPGGYEWKTACGIDLNENPDGTFEMFQIDGTLTRMSQH